MKFQLRGAGPPAPPSWRLCSKWERGKRSLQFFPEVSGVYQRNFACSKNSAVLEPKTGQFSRTWGFEAKAKDLTIEAKAKDFKMCPQGRPRSQGRLWGLHLCYSVSVIGRYFCYTAFRASDSGWFDWKKRKMHQKPYTCTDLIFDWFIYFGVKNYKTD